MWLFKKTVIVAVATLFILQAMPGAASGQKSREVVYSSNLYGTVSDSNSQPLVDVEVRIEGLDKVATTDEHGRFSFDELEPGPYTVEVLVPEFKPWNQDVVVPNEGKKLEIVLERAEEI